LQHKIIAVDFDGTLCTHNFPEIGIILPEHRRVINFIQRAKNNGSIIILWTCRENTEERKYLDEAVNFCKEHDIPVDYANHYPNPEFGGFSSRKPYADLYIDDKAVNASQILDIYK